jgi:hypothetical protein
MENNTPVHSIENTEHLGKSLIAGLNMVPLTREQQEADRIDADRFNHPQDYMSEEELKYFRSEENRKKFVAMFWK